MTGRDKKGDDSPIARPPESAREPNGKATPKRAVENAATAPRTVAARSSVVPRARLRDVEKAILLNGLDDAREIATSVEIDAAKAAIAERADYSAKYELGAAISKLDLIYELAIQAEDRRAALDAVKQKIAALKLYKFANAAAQIEEERDERDKIVRAYLESVGVCRRGLKLEELARRVAACLADVVLPEAYRARVETEAPPTLNQETVANAEQNAESH